MVKALPSNAGGMGSIPGQGAKIPHASWPKKTKHKKKERKKLKKEEIKKVQQNKMTVLDWVLPFWTLAPYSSKSSSPDGLFGVRRQSGALAQGTLWLYTCRPRDKKGESLPRAAIEGDTDS